MSSESPLADRGTSARTKRRKKTRKGRSSSMLEPVTPSSGGTQREPSKLTKMLSKGDSGRRALAGGKNRRLMTASVEVSTSAKRESNEASTVAAASSVAARSSAGAPFRAERRVRASSISDPSQLKGMRPTLTAEGYMECYRRVTPNSAAAEPTTSAAPTSSASIVNASTLANSTSTNVNDTLGATSVQPTSPRDSPRSDAHLYRTHWCVLQNGVLRCFEHTATRQASTSYRPELGILPSRADFEYDLARIRGIETAKDRTAFKILASGEEAHFVCKDRAEAHNWFFMMQRAVVHNARVLRKATISPRARPPSMRRAVRRHTVSGGSMLGGLSATQIRLGSFFEVFYAADTGRRRYMEDRSVVIHDLNRQLALDTAHYPPQTLLAVYDGHGGKGAAEFAMQRLHEHVCLHEQFRDDVGAAFRDGFVQCDAAFRATAVDGGDVSGTTATMLLMRGKRLHVANLGDCRVVLCRDGKAVELSSDHKPHREDEKERVEAAGGWIESVEVLNVPRLIALGLEDEELDDEREEMVGWVTVHRVNGCLGVTRSIGDILIKDWRDRQFEDVPFDGDLVVAEPELRDIDLESGDEFVVLASDGLWDVFSSEECVQWIRERVEPVTSVRAILTEELVQEAIERGSLDNISAIIVFFDHDKETSVTVDGTLDVFDMTRGTAAATWRRRFCVFEPRSRILRMYRHRRDVHAAVPPLQTFDLSGGSVRSMSVDALACASKLAQTPSSASGGGGAANGAVSSGADERQQGADAHTHDDDDDEEEEEVMSVPFGDLVSPRDSEYGDEAGDEGGSASPPTSPTDSTSAFAFQLVCDGVCSLLLKASKEADRQKWLLSFSESFGERRKT